MELYDFENQLQRKLKERSITPSPNAWERVAYNRKIKKQKRSQFWYWIAAASITGIGIFFFISQNNSKSEHIQVVVNKTAVPKAIESPVQTKDSSSYPIVVSPEITQQLQPVPTYKNIDLQIEDSLNKREIVAILPDPETKLAEKTADALAELVQKGKPVNENDVDALLAAAQKEIAMEKQKDNNQNTSTAALLSEAEEKSNKSFKDKVIDVFQKKFKTIKIAFKERHP